MKRIDFLLLLGWLAALPEPAEAHPDDSSPLLTLARRLLATPGPIATGQLANLFPGRFPPAFPTGLPVPSNARLLGGVERVMGPSEAVLDTSLDPGQVLEFYRQVLTGRGWNMQEQPAAPASAMAFARFVLERQNQTLMLSARGVEGGPTDVRLSLMTTGGTFAPLAGGGVGIERSMPQVVSPVDRGRPLSLSLPPRAVAISTHFAPLRPSGIGYWSAGFTLQQAIGEIAEYFSGQLQRTSWQLLERGGDTHLTWSTWKVSAGAKPELHGLLSVQPWPGLADRWVVNVRSEVPS